MFSTSSGGGCSLPATITVSKSFQPSSPRIAPKWAMLMFGSASSARSRSATGL